MAVVSVQGSRIIENNAWRHLKTTRMLRVEAAQAHSLLRLLLPPSVVNQLDDQSSTHFAEDLPNVSVMFVKLYGFAELTKRLPAEQLVALLNSVFSEFDALVQVTPNCNKIETVYQEYMVASNINIDEVSADHCAGLARLALQFRTVASRFTIGGQRLQIVGGIHKGNLTAGVIGQKLPRFR